MIELMIAIMILGLGLTMAATVFPVGLDMTRDTLQMQVSQAATDAALATVKLKVPGFQDMTALNAGAAAFERLLAATPLLDPFVASTTARLWAPIENDVAINNAEQEVLNTTAPSATPAGFPGWANWPGLNPTQQQPQDFIDRCRVFTEATAWDAELSTMGFAEAMVLTAQNFPADTPSGFAGMAVGNLLTPIVPVFGYLGATPASNARRSFLPRVSIVDSVYPPVDLLDATGAFKPVPAVMQEISERRYSWMIIHHRISSSPSVRDLLLSVVVMHRADPAARYARQKDRRVGTPTVPAELLQFDLTPPPTGPFDITNPTTNPNANAVGSLMLPLPDDTDTTPANGTVDTDSLFPQPWLVVLNSISFQTGEVQCTKEVARLMPVGAFFIIARSQANLIAGTAHKVLNATWDEKATAPDAPDKPSATLQITRDGTGSATLVPVWVFPPPIEARGNPPRFGARSPVVGVALRSVEAP